MKIMSLTCIQFLFIAVLVAVSQTWAADETLVLHLKLDEGKGKKVNILKFKRRKNSMKRQGHRQLFTEIQIAKIKA